MVGILTWGHPSLYLVLSRSLLHNEVNLPVSFTTNLGCSLDLLILLPSPNCTFCIYFCPICSFSLLMWISIFNNNHITNSVFLLPQVHKYWDYRHALITMSTIFPFLFLSCFETESLCRRSSFSTLSIGIACVYHCAQVSSLFLLLIYSLLKGTNIQEQCAVGVAPWYSTFLMYLRLWVSSQLLKTKHPIN